MSKHKRTRAFTRLLHNCTRLFTRFLRGLVKSGKALIILNTKLLLRILLGNSHQQRRGGFVLPTAVMLILVVTLVITALVFRTFTRTSQVISERQQQVIYNSATPAIDRAKAKLEYLFRQDTRKPSGVLSDSKLQSLLEAPSSGSDLYTLPDETRLVGFQDANNNSAIGWYFTQNSKTIAYSIIFKKQAVTTGTSTTSLQDTAANKAPYFVVRNGPVNTNNASKTSCGTTIVLSSNEKDWEPITSATLAKTFQVTAFVVDNPSKPNRSVTTLELQQDRQADKANKWGAYFRYDLELFNGPQFNWNGAMHTDGSLFLGSANFKAYLLSAPTSCVNSSPGDSKITASRYLDTAGNATFEGQFIAGKVNQQLFTGVSKFDLYNGDGNAPSSSTSTLDVTFQTTSNADSVKDSFETNATSSTTKPDSLALDPVALFTQEKFQARGTDATNTTYRDPQWINSNLFTYKRIFNEEATPPYLDDTYRADDRYGPGPTYDGKPFASSQVKIPAGNKIGDNIPTTDTNYSALTRNTPPDVTSPEALGLDGYWERRAVKGGLRLIVGQRLELGNPLGTATNLPTGREHEFLQRRTQRDNVAAVQATAVYHYKTGSGTTPVACLATTVHPGTAETLRRSATFETINFKANVGGTPPVPPVLVNDFFTGRGTNGWEFSLPNNVVTNTDLANARSNLAYFAGDPYGAFPAYQDTTLLPAISSVGTTTHPYSPLTKYGDFSNLRRAITSGSSSISDQSYIDTANCLLGMLAYNINYLNSYDYTQNWGTGSAQLLDDLNSALASKVGAVSAPDQAIKALNDNITNSDTAYWPIKNQLIQLARLIATKEQVKLDRINNTGYICSNTTTFNASATALNKLCPSGIKYDALYYIFPTSDHAELRTDAYILAVNPTAVTTRYKAVNLSNISISPNTGTWNIPRTDVTSSINTIPGQPGSLPNSNTPNLNNLVEYVDASNNTKYYQVAFKDAALFNGREMMNARTLDIDLNLLRTTNAPGGDTWLPINDTTATDTNASPPNGLVYAFREDAVREDGIARPAGTGMDARPSSASDPNISTNNSTGNGITTKPVDYLPDPDRRPYGFRLKNGSSINRGTSSAGMSFVSDNPVYIQGDFNLHSIDGTNTTSSLIEEFTGSGGKLATDWSNFYTRSTKDNRFATVPTSTTQGDYWRPTEVLGDAVTILSNNFCDGSIEDGIIYAGSNPLSSTIPPALNIANQYGCNNTTAASTTWTSYINQNRPSFAITNNTVFGTNKASTNNDWVRENTFDTLSPVKVSVNGYPMYTTSGGSSVEYLVLSSSNPPYTYLGFQDYDRQCGTSGKKCLSTATQTRVNATIVQNIIPSRAGQSYGGFHNFPRMIENWDQQNLFMSGAFIQLRFSTQATGAYDQDAWEPSQTADTGNEYILYYQPPNRLWGYDVALQYQTAGPVAQRFAISGTTRSEVYRELSLDDSYVKNLRCAKDTTGNRIDPTATCS